MPDWRLPEKEKAGLCDRYVRYKGEDVVEQLVNWVELAAQQRLAMWGNEPCAEHYVTKGRVVVRRNCPVCWQELCKELEVK